MKWIEPKDLGDLLVPGQKIFIAGGMSEPKALASALLGFPKQLQGSSIVETRLPGFRNEPYSDNPELDVTVFFRTRELAGSSANVRFVPMHYLETYAYLSEQVFDLALIEMAPTADAGTLSYGLTVDFVPAILDKAKCVVAEVNSALPCPPGSPTVSIDKIDRAVQLSRPPLSSESGTLEVAREIGRYASQVIPDGACLQTGIGAIPDAVLAALTQKNDLGCHSGMVGDGMKRLIETGVLNGKAKSFDAEAHITGFALGTPDLYSWVTTQPSVQFRPVNYTHDVGVIGAHERFVSINSAVEIDLMGQVNSEMVKGRQISGTGGALDFVRGAARSRGGRSIVAMTSTAASGKVSRIVPSLGTGTPVTIPRTDVDCVVTEFGVAELKGKSLEERAEALIAIAAPRFQDSLKLQS